MCMVLLLTPTYRSVASRLIHISVGVIIGMQANRARTRRQRQSDVLTREFMAFLSFLFFLTKKIR